MSWWELQKIPKSHRGLNFPHSPARYCSFKLINADARLTIPPSEISSRNRTRLEGYNCPSKSYRYLPITITPLYLPSYQIPLQLISARPLLQVASPIKQSFNSRFTYLISFWMSSSRYSACRCDGDHAELGRGNQERGSPLWSLPSVAHMFPSPLTHAAMSIYLFLFPI